MTRGAHISLSSAEVQQLCDITPRQLQWWDEKGVVRAVHSGHRRQWSFEECVCVAVLKRVTVGRGWTKGWYRDNGGTSIIEETRRAMKNPLNRFLVFLGKSCKRCKNGEEVIRTVAKARAGAVVVDLEEIERRIERGARRSDWRAEVA